MKPLDRNNYKVNFNEVIFQEKNEFKIEVIIGMRMVR